MADKQINNGIFREKTLQAADSPDSLNAYLKVTSPGIWLVLTAVIAVLIGNLLWSIFGSIESTIDVAVIAENNQCVCLVPYENLDSLEDFQGIAIDGTTYNLEPNLKASPEVLQDSANPYALVAGNLSVGDVIVEVPVDAELSDNVYTGTIVTESIHPISLLLQ